jgi:hypothetical protein
MPNREPPMTRGLQKKQLHSHFNLDPDILLAFIAEHVHVETETVETANVETETM